MKPEWYADKRDLAKWAVLFTIAKKYRIKTIVQVAYYRDSQWGLVHIGNSSYELPKEVIKHFRDLYNIKGLEKDGLEIIVFGNPLKNRKEYQKDLLHFIKNIRKKVILFLDPDTGLEPENSSPSLKHVLKEELAQIWKELEAHSVLVFYQHKYRNKNWVDLSKKRIATSLGYNSSQIIIGKTPRIANDVVFFIACK